MAGTKNGQWIARNLLIGAAMLLVAGIVGSLYMGVRARDAAVKTTTNGASMIADKSLSLVFAPEDLAAPVSSARATTLDSRVAAVVLDPSTFDSVTLWSSDGRILYSTGGRIGSAFDAEKTRIRNALRGTPQTESSGGSFSVMVPLKLSSGVGEPAAVELTTPASPIDGAPAPWRTNALFLTLLLAVVGFALYRVMAAPRPAASSAALVRAAMQPAPAAATAAVASPGLREEAEARRKAEDRARAAEDRLSVLQDQYRSTLDELRNAEHRIQEQAAEARPDAHVQEQIERTEQRAREFELRARELETKYRLLEEEHRELARLAPDPDIMAKANDRLEALKAERDQLRRERDVLVAERQEREELGLEAPQYTEDPALLRRVQQAETESIGLRAELEGAQTQMAMARRELDGLHGAHERASELQEDLDAAHVEALHTRESFESAQSELASARTELEDARSELRVMRNEEQRAAMLEDELRASRAELESASASHRAELMEREAELEDKVRILREGFQEHVEAQEAAHLEAIAEREAELAERLAVTEAAQRDELERLERQLADRDERYGTAEQAVAEAQQRAGQLEAELGDATRELAATTERLETETESVRAIAERAERAEKAAAESIARAGRLGDELEAATQDNAELNRRLQELEARRALEIAEGEGRANLDDLLRITQERLAGQTEKLIGAEDRVHQLERDLHAKLERIDEVEGELRHVQMAEAMRQIRGEGHDDAPEGEAVAVPDATEPAHPEDRRATTPFIKELSLDAHRSLMQILGLTQILKHKRDPKEQGQLVRQLTAYARRLDHVVADMSDADSLAHGTIELNLRRTDLEPMLRRLVEESGVDADHEVNIEAERVVVNIDQLRTEQIVSGLLRASGDRTPANKIITVRLSPHEGGALISVEDPEPSSDASLSPVVQRFAEVQGGWATVQSDQDGGSAFRVFLPDGAKAPEASEVQEPEATDEAGAETADVPDPQPPVSEAPADDLHIVVEDGQEAPSESWSQSPEQLLVQELHRLSEITAED